MVNKIDSSMIELVTPKGITDLETLIIEGFTRLPIELFRVGTKSNSKNTILNAVSYLSNNDNFLKEVYIKKSSSDLFDLILFNNPNGSEVVNFKYYDDFYPIGDQSRPYTKGDWLVGDIVINTDTTKNPCDGWICREKGTPGVWFPMVGIKPFYSYIEEVDELPQACANQCGRQVFYGPELDKNIYYCINKGSNQYEWLSQRLYDSNLDTIVETKFQDMLDNNMDDILAQIGSGKSTNYTDQTEIVDNHSYKGKMTSTVIKGVTEIEGTNGNYTLASVAPLVINTYLDDDIYDTLAYPQVLRSIDEVRDEIRVSDGTFIQRINELDDLTDLVVDDASASGNFYTYKLEVPYNSNLSDDAKLLTNMPIKFVASSEPLPSNLEYYTTNSSDEIVIKIDRSRLADGTAASLISWFSTNSYIILYKIDNPIANAIDTEELDTPKGVLKVLAVDTSVKPLISTTIGNDASTSNQYAINELSRLLGLLSGTPSTPSGSAGGDLEGTYPNPSVKNDSHTHDGRYYTETEIDTNFVNKNNILDTLEEIEANTESEEIAGALAVKELNSSLTSIDVYVGEDEKLHFVDSAGADTVLNFSSNPMLKTNLVFQWSGNGSRFTSTELVLKTACVIYFSDMSIARLSPANTDGYIQVYLNGEEIKSYELSYNNNITTLNIDDFTVSVSAEDTLLIKLSTPSSASSGNVQIKLSYVVD